MSATETETPCDLHLPDSGWWCDMPAGHDGPHVADNGAGGGASWTDDGTTIVRLA